MFFTLRTWTSLRDKNRIRRRYKGCKCHLHDFLPPKQQTMHARMWLLSRPTVSSGQNSAERRRNLRRINWFSSFKVMHLHGGQSGNFRPNRLSIKFYEPWGRLKNVADFCIALIRDRFLFMILTSCPFPDEDFCLTLRFEEGKSDSTRGPAFDMCETHAQYFIRLSNKRRAFK